MKRSPFISLIAVCLLCAIVLSSCTLVPQRNSSTPGSTPTATPNESTPTESTPTESTPTASSPESSMPEPPVSSAPEASSPAESSEPDGPDDNAAHGIYIYNTLPNAFTELSADTRAAIETAVGASVDWDKHYLGIHEGYIIFGTYDASNPKIFKRRNRYFGKLTELYGYKDDELHTFRELLENDIIGFYLLTYISYLGLEKEVDRLPVASEELSEKTISKIKSQYSNFEDFYFGTCGGYVVFGNGGNIADGYESGIRQIQNHIIYDFISVATYSPEGVFDDFFTVCNRDLEIDYSDIVDTILIANLIGVRTYIPKEYRITK